MDAITLLLFFTLLIISIIAHEVAHGYAAYSLGDPTAYYEGRLTLNPVPHFDFFGSFLVPMISYFTAGFIFGWAKPVPYNPYNLRHGRAGEALVAAAGPFTNVVIALVFGLIYNFAGAALPATFLSAISLLVTLNVTLAVVNLLPIPTLDGGKILFSILPYRFAYLERSLEPYGIFVLLGIVLFGWSIIGGIVVKLSELLL